jgi:hypothetical protein
MNEKTMPRVVHRKHGVAKRVAVEDGPAREAAGTCGADEVVPSAPSIEARVMRAMGAMTKSAMVMAGRMSCFAR